MDLIQIFEQYGMIGYAIFIFFGGRYGVKVLKFTNKSTLTRFNIFATVFAILFLIIEASIGHFRWDSIIKYILTYTVVTSCYENVVEMFPFLKPKNKDNE